MIFHLRLLQVLGQLRLLISSKNWMLSTASTFRLFSYKSATTLAYALQM